MQLTLRVIAGSVIGEEIALEPGQPVRIGSDPQWCDQAFPGDKRMSPVHFSITLETGRAAIRDLNSRLGTQVNGTRVVTAFVKEGDTIAAGETVFQLKAEGKEEEKKETAGDPKKIPQRVLEELRKLDEPLFALLDSARDEQVRDIMGHEGAEAQSLFEGEGAEKLLTVAPYLVQIDKRSRLLERLVVNGWGQSWGVYLTSTQAFGSLRSHFRQFLMVQDEQKRQLYFRFYDPRVLRTYLPTCASAEANHFFGGVTRFWMEDEEEGTVIEYTRGPKGAQGKKWRVQTDKESLVSKPGR